MNMSDRVLPPIFSDVPFKKVKIPDDLYSHMMDEYDVMEFTKVDDAAQLAEISQDAVVTVISCIEK